MHTRYSGEVNSGHARPPTTHNGGPPLVPFSKRRWALALLAHPKKPAGAVAMGFKLFMEMGADGTGATIPDCDFVDCCGVSERACQNFKRWLIDHGFISIQVKGHKGRSNTFSARIPAGLTAPDAANQDVRAAYIAGKNHDERHALPAKISGLPARIATDTGLTATNAGNPSAAKESFPHTPFKENKPINNLPISHLEPPAREGEESIGHGVFVNCETIRHKDFTISLPSLELSIAGRLPKTEVKAKAAAHALQWAAEIDAGKKPADVVPTKIANFLAASLMGDINRAATADAKLAKAKQGAKPFKPSRW
jgi:hypothetical protein